MIGPRCGAVSGKYGGHGYDLASGFFRVGFLFVIRFAITVGSAPAASFPSHAL
jgi:hypothetical protein